MKRSRIQAVYKYLPGMWVAEKNEDGRAITAKITGWNYTRMENIYASFIEGEIQRQVKLFGDRGGNISAYGHGFDIVEPAMNPGIEDIKGELSPLLYYCSSCHHVFQAKSPADWLAKDTKCPNCKKPQLKQLQMIYPCECGFAQPVSEPYVKGHPKMEYYPNENAFVMQYRVGQSMKKAELAMTCPVCRTRLVLTNIQSGKIYKPFTMRTVNLVDAKSGKFFDKGLDAQKVVIAEWFGALTRDEYNHILENVDTAFSENTTSSAKRAEAENQAKALVQMGMLTPDMLEGAIRTILSKSNNTGNVEQYTAACDQIYAERIRHNEDSYDQWVNSFSFRLMQYNTLKYPPRQITLQDAVRHQIEIGYIRAPEDIYCLNDDMGIHSVQVSEDIEIITCAYGYTRLITDPMQAKKSGNLKLVSFDKSKNNKDLVYGSRLQTEGILFEIDRRRIVEWMLKNDIITDAEAPDLDDDIVLKKWFSENINADAITTFGGVEEGEKITKAVFSLLHSMSHAFMKTAGEISGLSDTSLTEIIIPETTSIFIYAQTSQGLTLGAISGMFESNYYTFLKKALNDNRNCFYDPICTDRDDTACSACMLLPETTCAYFNADLGRKYLYSLKSENGHAMTGFWEM